MMIFYKQKNKYKYNNTKHLLQAQKVCYNDIIYNK